MIFAVTDVEVLESEEHEGKICDMEWSFACNRKAHSVASEFGGRDHDVRTLHPDEKNGRIFGMAHSQKVTVGEVHGGVRLSRP